MSDQSSFNLSTAKTGPVECLGQTFPSEEARREQFLKLLAAKLKEPAFRQIEGFPLGTDEAILALSDPPYYTACPNPWLGDFIKHYGTTYDPKKPYHREPFAADVSEGKTHPIYLAHSYHTKVPHRAIMRYILHYTEPGQLVFDGFCGTGMTGVAAQLCGDRTEVQELGYRVQDDGTILNEEGKPFSKLGARRAVLNDLSPAASFIASNYVLPFDHAAFSKEASRILAKIETDIGWLYETNHKKSEKKGRINYTVWSDVFTCPECGGEIVFWEDAVEDGDIKDGIQCPHCKAELQKRNLDRTIISQVNPDTKKVEKKPKRQPVLINYTFNGEKYEKALDEDDLAIIEKLNSHPISEWYPTTPMERDSDLWMERDYTSLGVFAANDFYSRRNLVMCAFARQAIMDSPPDMRRALWFWFQSVVMGFSLVNRYLKNAFSQVNRILSGTLYIGAMQSEVSPWYSLSGKISRFRVMDFGKPIYPVVSTMSSTQLSIPPESLDYIFIDPPFGSNIIYSDLSFLWEAWLGLTTHLDSEAVVHRRKKEGRSLGGYADTMRDCFELAYRSLKPGRWMTIEFSNTRSSVWNAIQTALQEAGFVVANVAALDKQMGSFKAVTTTTAVKQDLVISAYKPNGGLEARFAKHGQTTDGVWDFIRTHLRNLPVTIAKGGQLEHITERDPRILYDRMVAFYIGHSTPVPLSSGEFQAELQEQFPIRDGMAFLPEQVNIYDAKRVQMDSIGQLAIFVEDERSAIDWVRQFLKDRPSTTADITPDFMQQLSASWKKWEARPELRVLLDQNFLCYDGVGEVPSQIHSYLSTQFKELRNLDKDHAQLRHKAKDRWYVPDPKKNIDVETLRNKRLLEEFWLYLPEGYISAARNPDKAPTLPGMAAATPRPKVPRSKKLREVRTEAIRVGFKYCYQSKDYYTILAVADMLPESVLNEDEQLQMLYDNAAMRSGASDS
jgi:hypothetical protein